MPPGTRGGSKAAEAADDLSMSCLHTRACYSERLRSRWYVCHAYASPFKKHLSTTTFDNSVAVSISRTCAAAAFNSEAFELLFRDVKMVLHGNELLIPLPQLPVEILNLLHARIGARCRLCAAGSHTYIHRSHA